MPSNPRLLTTEDLFRVRWLTDPQISPDGQRLAFTASALDHERDALVSQVYLCDVQGQGLRTVGPSDTPNHSPRWSPNSQYLIIIAQQDLWLINAADGSTRALSLTLRDVSEPTWSPDGQQLVFSSAAPSGHKQLWHLNLAERIALQLTDGTWDCTAPRWSPDGQHIAFLSNRTDDAWCMDVWVTTPAGAEPAQLTDSTGPIRVLAWSPDSQHIAFIGHAQGGAQGVNFGVWQTSLTDRTQAPRQLTDALDRSMGQVVRADDLRGMEAPSLQWTEAGIYFAFADGGCSHIGRVTTAGEVQPVVTGRRAVLSFSVAHAANALAFVAADAQQLGEVYIADAQGQGERRVTDCNAWLREVQLSEAQAITFTASDGQTIESWLMRPPVIARSKVGDEAVSDGSRVIAQQAPFAGAEIAAQTTLAMTSTNHGLPLILQIHGGPHYPLGERFYFDFQRLAAQGYAILYVNMRGSQGYGEKFATEIRGAWGERDCDDLLEALDVALSSGELDESRIAVTGVSYGGYMTHWLIGHTTRFHAALSENGIGNLVTSFATSLHGEAFWQWEMGGTPTTQPERYRALSPITYVAAMHTPLLMIHAEQDANCAIAQSEELLAALQSLGREAALVRIPDEGHLMNLVGKPSHRLMRMQAMDAWWARWLKESCNAIG